VAGQKPGVGKFLVLLVLITASKATFKLSESPDLTLTAMTTIRRFAADDAHVIYGTAYDESLGNRLRVTVSPPA